MSKKINSDLEVVGSLAQNKRLPLPPLSDGCMKSLAKAINEAFNIMLANDFAFNQSSTEDRITTLLQIELNKLVKDKFEYQHYFTYFARNASFVSFDGSSLNKSPDLSVRLSKSVCNNFPLQIEAKIIDIPNGKSLELYHKNGIMRFQNGDYAWYARESYMVAYVMDGSSIAGELHPYLKSKKSKSIVSLPKPINQSSEDLAISEHFRSFSYLIPPYGKPGPIKLWHLWLRK